MDKTEIAPSVFVFNSELDGDRFVRFNAQICQ